MKRIRSGGAGEATADPAADLTPDPAADLPPDLARDLAADFASDLSRPPALSAARPTAVAESVLGDGPELALADPDADVASTREMPNVPAGAAASDGAARQATSSRARQARAILTDAILPRPPARALTPKAPHERDVWRLGR